MKPVQGDPRILAHKSRAPRPLFQSMSKKEGEESRKAAQLEELKDLGDMRTKLHINWHHVAAHANVLCADGANVSARTCRRAISAGAKPVKPAAVAKLVQWLVEARHAVAAGKTPEDAFAAAAV